MENNLPLHLKNFNDKVKVMNQSGKQSMMLTAQEARSIHSDMFELMSLCVKMSKQMNSSNNAASSVNMDGGSW